MIISSLLLLVSSYKGAAALGCFRDTKDVREEMRIWGVSDRPDNPVYPMTSKVALTDDLDGDHVRFNTNSPAICVHFCKRQGQQNVMRTYLCIHLLTYLWTYICIYLCSYK